MKVSDIKVGCIYNVLFDPVQECEFNGKHLALVLKKNNDNKTFIVMPLTSSSKGVGISKIKIGQIKTLPTSLRVNDTYAVLNQVRTLNANRFIALKEGNIVIESKMDYDWFDILLNFSIRELIYSLDVNRRIRILRSIYEYECIEKAKDMAYNIIRIEKYHNNKEAIFELKKEIREILKDIPYYLDEKYIKDGIKTIFDDAINS